MQLGGLLRRVNQVDFMYLETDQWKSKLQGAAGHTEAKKIPSWTLLHFLCSPQTVMKNDFLLIKK